MRPLPRTFYDRPTLEVARDLLGKVLVHRQGRSITSGMIVEVEAYIGESDPACHAAPGPTSRNEPLYGPPGYAYVYLNYGIHCLVNVVSEAQGSPAAILIRALDPLDGVPIMRRRRAGVRKGRRPGPAAALPDYELCRGPGNLTMAMAITLGDNRRDLLGERLYIEDRALPIGSIAWGPRIGIRVGVDRPWRARLIDNPAVSGRAYRFSSSRGSAFEPA
jgi:DNA-3-methyladenine glycosylase